ncbi:MAG: helix-turn-helix domain-containing protein [Planctomycetaceae bacterium]|nr:helix-turn-helix domain-containing protein [Planctomycetaceae bacterium]
MKRSSKADRRSDCPLSIALEIFGDRWTLLILRDLVFKGRQTFKAFQESGEQIASNVLADRLLRLQDHGIVVGERSSSDARVVTYRPTSKGLDLVPVLIEIVLWSARYEETAAPPKLLDRMINDRDGFLREIRQRFAEPRDA